MEKGTLGWPRGLLRKRGLLGFPDGRMPREAAELMMGVDPATSQLSLVTSAAGANTKGAWTTLPPRSGPAVTPFQADGIILNCQQATALRDFIVDIGIGGAGDAVDQILIENLQVAAGNDFQCPVSVPIPIRVPAGVRLAARAQASTGSSTLGMGVAVCRGGIFAANTYGRAKSYGFSLADSGGTSVDPGAVGNTKGAWSVLAASMEAPIDAAVLSIGSQLNPTINPSQLQLVDVGYGPAGSEVVVAGDIGILAGLSEDYYKPVLHPLNIRIPAGSRLVVRSQCAQTTATDRLFDAAILGLW